MAAKLMFGIVVAASIMLGVALAADSPQMPSDDVVARADDFRKDVIAACLKRIESIQPGADRVTATQSEAIRLLGVYRAEEAVDALLKVIDVPTSPDRDLYAVKTTFDPREILTILRLLR